MTVQLTQKELKKYLIKHYVITETNGHFFPDDWAFLIIDVVDQNPENMVRFQLMEMLDWSFELTLIRRKNTYILNIKK